MSIQDTEVLARAAQHFATNELTPDDQTLIALFLQATKGANATALSKILLAPLDWIAYRFMHEQYFRELEMISLLTKATSWSMNPQVFAKAMQLSMNFMQRTGIAEHLASGKTLEGKGAEIIFYEYLALSHAFMAQIRIVPLLPAFRKLDTPFLDAINEIETNNGRLIQTQIRMLKDLKTSIPLDEREAIITRNTDVVIDLFTDLIRHICMPETRQ